MTFSHDGPICASLGHFVGHVTLAYCPHLSAWVMCVSAGDESDDSHWRSETVRFGPFDSLDDVERRARAEVSRLMRADRSGWAASQQER